MTTMESNHKSLYNEEGLTNQRDVTSTSIKRKTIFKDWASDYP